MLKPVKPRANVFATSPGHLIKVAARRLGAVLAEELDQAGISLADYHFLRSLSDEDGLSQIELSTRNAIDPGGVANQLARLEEAGLVRRVRDRDDRRKLKVYLTAEGRKKREPILRIVEPFHAALLDGISPPEYDRFQKTLAKLLRNADAFSEARRRERRSAGA